MPTLKSLLIQLLLGTAILFGLGIVMFPENPMSLSQTFGMMLFGLAITADSRFASAPRSPD